MDNSTVVTLKTIADMENEGVKFYIDAYQRGYRWTGGEVRDLLDDIHEFSQSSYKSTTQGVADRFYCLQPIIVVKTEGGDAWKVIDGQQRMTTLYLIYLYYVNIAGKKLRQPLPFELHYNGKCLLEECLHEIHEEQYSESEELGAAFEKYDKDIDCYFILTAYAEICKFFDALYNNSQLRNHPNDMKAVFDNYMKIIWYELVNCNAETEVSMFTKINMGKIPLTNAELIKALLLRTENDEMTNYQKDIAFQWDEMEAQLTEPNFWSFLVNDNDSYSTRIDFIFEIMAGELNEGELKTYSEKNPDKEPLYIEQAYNKQYFSFYVFHHYVRLLEESEPKTDYVKKIWNWVKDYYQMFSDWYHNRKWYHMIGYLVEASGTSYINRLGELSRLYQSQGSKRDFEENLRKLIVQEIEPGGNITNHRELKEYVQKLEYNKSSNAEIRNILLLHNICTLELLEEHTNARFPFEKYKSKKIAWDIEHINAVADDRPYDAYDREENKCLVWLNNAKALTDLDKVTTTDGKNAALLIQKIIDGKLYLPKNENGTPSFVSAYEAVINHYGDSDETDHSMANLTLLDAGTNRAYKNDVFPLKRKKILEYCSKEVYIPLCTKNVFLKAYVQSADLLKWTKNDKEAYVADMIGNISKYLGLEEKADGDE